MGTTTTRLTSRLVFGLLFALAVALPGSARATSIVDVPVRDAAGRRALAEIPGIEQTGHGPPGTATVIVGGRALSELRAEGLRPRVRVADLGARLRAARRADRAYAAQGASPLPSGRGSYRRLGDYGADLDALVRRHPTLVRPLTLSRRSLEGRPIRGVEISAAVNAPDGKPVLLVLGVHHAREWPSGELSIEFAHDLAQGFGKNARITKLLERARVIVVPVVNPDGFNASREAPVDPQDQNTSTVLGVPGNASSYRRKNCRASGSSAPSQPMGTCEANPGVDLNRNYGTNWGSNGASSFEEAPDYRGAGPFSEPESQAIRELVAQRAVTMLITNHTFGRLVLRPPGVKSIGSVPDDLALKAIADRMASATGYVSERSWELYDNSGTTEDWSYGVTGAYGFTIESSDQNFHEAYEKAVVREYSGADGGGNREAFLLGLEAAVDRSSHSVVEGFAPPGRVLRLSRTVGSLTGPVCVSQPTGFFSTGCGPTMAPRAFEDRLQVSRVVGDDGVVSWHVNPSVSPLAQASGPWQMTCENAAGQVLERRTVALGRGGVGRVFLSCGAERCEPARAVRKLILTGGRRLRVRLALLPRARGARVAVLRSGAGRLGTPTPLRLRRGRAAWTPVRDGTYVLRVRARTRSGRLDVRRQALEVRHGKASRGPAYARADRCGELRVARLLTPSFSSRGPRQRLLLRAPAQVEARVRVLRGKRTVLTRRVTLRGGRTERLALPRVRGPKVTVRVSTSRGTRLARRTGRATLRARGR